MNLFVFNLANIIGAVFLNINVHYSAEVYPNRHGQIFPMCVSRVRFYYVNTLKVVQYCGK